MTESVAGPSLQAEKAKRSGTRAKKFVVRACDRCRKKKTKCDGVLQCYGCAQAEVKCTYDAPVLKRGPHTKPPIQRVEDRVRSLERLYSNRLGGGSGAAASMIAGELPQVPNVPEPLWSGLHGASAGTETGPGPEGGHILPTFGLPNTFSDAYATPAVGVAGPSSSSRATGAAVDVWPCAPPQTLPTTVRDSPSPPASVPSQDLLYRDAEGQTKWLGASRYIPVHLVCNHASFTIVFTIVPICADDGEGTEIHGGSGMPLLDRLTLSMGRFTSIEEWVSLSAAIGLQVGANQGLPLSVDTSDVRGELQSDHGNLWAQLLDVCPQDLLDSLIQGYFTISHLLWPILHAPTFMAQYRDPAHLHSPSFVCLVMSLCSLSSRYTQDPRLEDIAPRLIHLGREAVVKLAAERRDIYLVQALFNMSVVQEGTLQPHLLWTYLCQALSMAADIGLGRRVDTWSTFTPVDVEVRKRTVWALYCQQVKASCTFGRSPAHSASDLVGLGEPAAVDDVYISVEGVGTQPTDRPSVMAGFVAAIRLHVIMEQTIRRLNRGPPADPAGSWFFDMMGLTTQRPVKTPPEHEVLTCVTVGLPGDWAFDHTTVLDPDSVRFFQKARVSTLSHYIRLLVARDRFAAELEATREEKDGLGPWRPALSVSSSTLQQIAQSATDIIWTYCLIDGHGRLRFFGVHAIAQLTQAGLGLIGIILHLSNSTEIEGVLHVAKECLPLAVHVLRELGRSRPAGLRAAETLSGFSKVYHLPVLIPDPSDASITPDPFVEVPVLRSLPRKQVTATAKPSTDEQNGPANFFYQWLGIDLMGPGGGVAGSWPGDAMGGYGPAAGGSMFF